MKNVKIYMWQCSHFGLGKTNKNPQKYKGKKLTCLHFEAEKKRKQKQINKYIYFYKRFFYTFSITYQSKYFINMNNTKTTYNPRKLFISNKEVSIIC